MPRRSDGFNEFLLLQSVRALIQPNDEQSGIRLPQVGLGAMGAMTYWSLLQDLTQIPRALQEAVPISWRGNLRAAFLGNA